MKVIKVQLVGGRTYFVPVDGEGFSVLVGEITDAEVGDKWIITKTEISEDEYYEGHEFEGH